MFNYQKNIQKVRALTIEQQRTLIEAIEDSKEDKAQAVTLSLNTGMRIGEVAALKWENVDFARGIISVNKTCNRIQDVLGRKTIVNYDSVKSDASQRIIPMNQKVQQLLERLKEKIQVNLYSQ